MTEPFRILFVCSGNVCRSPVAERLLQASLNTLQPGKFVVRSAGTRALVGQTMTDQAAHIIWHFGGNADGFLARQLTQDAVAESDLILALSREHRSSVVQAVPAALRRTFTFREFGRMTRRLVADGALQMSPDDAGRRWVELVARVPLVRPEVLADHEEDDDVVDPFQKSASKYRQMYNELAPAMESLVDFERRYAAV